MGVAFAIACVGACLSASDAAPASRHEISSPFQPSPVAIEVLAPDRVEADKRYPVLYILPVEADETSRWGSGMEEARKADLANRYGVFCVYPGFSDTPWFANHPSDPALQ